VALKAISGLLRYKSPKTREIYLHSIDESQRAALTQIEEKFTPKRPKPQPIGASKNKKEATGKP
jgi:hypothetical protein